MWGSQRASGEQNVWGSNPGGSMGFLNTVTGLLSLALVLARRLAPAVAAGAPAARRTRRGLAAGPPAILPPHRPARTATPWWGGSGAVGKHEQVSCSNSAHEWFSGPRRTSMVAEQRRSGGPSTASICRSEGRRRCSNRSSILVKSCRCLRDDCGIVRAAHEWVWRAAVQPQPRHDLSDAGSVWEACRDGQQH